MDPHEPLRGEAWWANLEPTRGDEIRKTRPVVVMSNDHIGRLRLRIVVPITDWDDRYSSLPWMVLLTPNAANGLRKASAADAFQVRSLSIERFESYIGKLKNDEVEAIASAIGMCVKT